jgi:hypothetical protein
VPKFTSTHDAMVNCPVCLAAKMKYRARGSESTRKATRPFQGFSIDFAFAGQRSKDKNTAVNFVGCGGETSYILLAEHFTEKSCGATRISKVPPVAWLRRFFLQHIQEQDPKNNQCIFLDQGGNSICAKLCAIFQRKGSSSIFIPLASKLIIKKWSH